ncbi:hypothetical protein IEO21_07043 [Rhodonia placenta]|uniref:Uncharacterized protein n=1 Tax=Rhodonia placenta TaxID=104341 RepID=A0A8H7NZ91_9APHY|nr:hypothetical protein IEO21_07043 [Postia placenta]
MHLLSEFLAVLALRTHAVSSANWYLVLPVLLLGLVPVGTNLQVLIATRISVVFSDILVVGATWYYLLIHRPAALAHTQLFSMVLVSKPHLPTLVLRDGTLYFLSGALSTIRMSLIIRDLKGYLASECISLGMEPECPS